MAVVTGGASGIGFGMAEAFAAEGMKIVLADIEAAALAEAAEKLRAGGADVLDVVTDVSVEDQVIDLATNTYTHFGTAHIVCNNAGVGGGGGLMWEIPQSGWDWTFGVNFWGVLHGIRAFTPRLVEQEEGHIINTASIAGLKALPFMSPYTATKHAVVGISEALAVELVMTRIAGEGVGALPRLHPHPAASSPSATGRPRSGDAPQIEDSPIGDDGARPRRGRQGAGRPRGSASSPRCAPSSSSSSVTTRTPACPIARGEEARTGAQPDLPDVSDL